MSSTTASGSGDPAEATEQPQKHFFGIRQDPLRHGYVFNDDYDQRFPEDEYCKETAPNARVWRTYVEEAAAFDANMMDNLATAGLFSAVVTSFLVQVSQSLQADYGQMTAVLLHDIVFIQLAMADGTSVTNITRPSIDPTAPFVTAGMNVWVNGLWVVSLTASLAVALAAVLVTTSGPCAPTSDLQALSVGVFASL
ncbi:hypothetical protein CPB85DRAFT_1432404 [Mucidula mucida]|nr:hypothetical protein CPB85DRAFT_1432404 [Mucidula mucida]